MQTIDEAREHCRFVGKGKADGEAPHQLCHALEGSLCGIRWK